MGAVMDTLMFPGSAGTFGDGPTPHEQGHELVVDLDPPIRVPCALFRCCDPLHPRSLMIYFHGNAEDLAAIGPLMRLFSDRLGLDVLAVEYPGYGSAPPAPRGATGEQEAMATAWAAWRYAIDCLGFRSERAVICGRSIGTGVATRIASLLCRGGTPPAALVLISPFLSVNAIPPGLAGIVARWCLEKRFPNDDLIGGVTCPLLLLHGASDSFIPPLHSLTLLSLCPSACKRLHIIPEATHVEMFLDSTATDIMEDYMMRNVFAP